MKLEFKKERDDDFLSSYKSVLKKHGREAPFMKKEPLLRQAVLSPAKKFYVSYDQAFRVISKVLSGKGLSIKNPIKRTMYTEIISRVRKELENTPDSLGDIIYKVLNQEAPRFYLTIDSAQILYYELLKNKK